MDRKGRAGDRSCSRSTDGHYRQGRRLIMQHAGRWTGKASRRWTIQHVGRCTEAGQEKDRAAALRCKKARQLMHQAAGLQMDRNSRTGDGHKKCFGLRL